MSDAPGAELTRRMDRDFQEEFLTCSLCSESYDQGIHIAKYLPCLHTFCKACLIRYIENRKECLCPVCRKTSLVPKEGVDGIPSNFTVENLKEYRAIFRAEPGQKHGLQCTSCDDGLDANSFCHDCGHFLCNTCTDAHRKMRQLKGHALSSIAELQQKMRSPSLLRKERCDQHKGQELSLYCLKCSVTVCNTCAIAGHERSEGHLLVDLDEEVENAKLELRRTAQRVRQQEEPNVRLSGHIDSKINGLSNTCAKMETDICEFFRELKSRLDERRDAALLDLRQLCQAKAKFLRQQKDTVESVATQISSACEFAERACTSANPSQLLGARSQVLDRLQELSTIEFKPLLTEHNFTLTFHHSHAEAAVDVENAMPNLGLITSTSITHPAVCQIRLHEPIVKNTSCFATITAVDTDLLDTNTRDCEKFQAEIISHDISTKCKNCPVSDNADGTYTVHFTPDVTGNHTMIIKLFGEEISKSPLDFVVKNVTVPANVTWETAFPEIAHTIVVDILQDNENEVVNFTTESLSATITTSDGQVIPNRVNRKQDGPFKVKYTPVTAGNLKASICINDRAVDGSPFIIRVQNVSPASTSVIWDLFPVVNQLWRIYITSKSDDGTLLTTGGLDIVTRVTDSSSALEIPCKMIDNKDGTYTVSCIPRTKAVHMIRIILDKVLIGSGLYEIPVQGSSIVGKPGLVEPTCLAINKINHEVCMVDVKTNAIVSPDAIWELTRVRRRLDPVGVPSCRIAFDSKGGLYLMTPHTRCLYIKQGPKTDMWMIPSEVLQPVTITLTNITDEIIIGDSKSDALFVLSITGSLIRKIPLSPGCMTNGIDNVCVDSKDNIFVCHGADNTIFRIDSEGNTTRVLQMVGKHKLWLAIATTPENALLVSQRHGNILVVDVQHERPIFRQEIQAGNEFDFHALAVEPIGGYVLALDADGKRVVKYGYRGCLPPFNVTDEEVCEAQAFTACLPRRKNSKAELTLVENVFL